MNNIIKTWWQIQVEEKGSTYFILEMFSSLELAKLNLSNIKSRYRKNTKAQFKIFRFETLQIEEN